MCLVKRMGMKRNAYKDFVERPEGKRRHRWGIILKWTLKIYDVKVWAGVSGSRSGQVLVCCEHGNDPFVYHLGNMVSIVVSTNVS